MKSEKIFAGSIEGRFTVAHAFAWALGLLLCTLPAWAQEDAEVLANLYFLPLRYETSTAIKVEEDSTPVRTSRQLAWLGAGGSQKATLNSGRITGPFRYKGSPHLVLGQETLSEGDVSIRAEADCEIASGDMLVLLFPSREDPLSVEQALAVALPDLDGQRQQVMVLNLSSHQLAMNLSRSGKPLFVQPLGVSLLPKDLLGATLRLDMAINNEERWMPIAGTRLMLGGAGMQLVVVHPSFTERSGWVIRTHRINTLNIL